MYILMFGVIYAVITMIGTAMGMHNFYIYIGIAIFFMAIQYLVGPKIVEWSMNVNYVNQEDFPELHSMVTELSSRAGIPKPRVGVSPKSLPNAFAFGRSIKDGRVCVTEGILRTLKRDELRAVLGHELSHIKNRDVLTITLLSVIPLVMYRIAWHLLFFGSYGRRRSGGGYTALIGLAALLFYFISNLIVLYASRIREYFADRGSIELGNRPESLASALYKLVYHSAATDKDRLKDVEGLKAFFLNDPSRSEDEIMELSDIDIDKDGIIDRDELEILKRKQVSLNFQDKLMELLSTHPDMLMRIKKLSDYN